MMLRQKHNAFTLIELLIIIAIISILTAIALSSLARLFGAGAKAQAENVIDAQLRVARSLAIRERCYAGVRFQADYRNANAYEGDYWAVIVQEAETLPTDADVYEDPNGIPVLDPDEEDNLRCGTPQSSFKLFRHVPEIPPAKLPDGVAVGRQERFSECNQMEKYTTFTIVFAPDGRLVTAPGEVNARYVLKLSAPNSYRADELFCDRDSSGPKEWKIFDPMMAIYEWKNGAGGPNSDCVPTLAVRVVDLKELGSSNDKDFYLNEYAKPLPVAPYVGGLLRAAPRRE